MQPLLSLLASIPFHFLIQQFYWPLSSKIWLVIYRQYLLPMNNNTDATLAMDMALGTKLWESFVTSPIGQWDMLEAYLSGICFAIYIIFFRLLDQVPSMRKYRISQGTKPIPLFQPDPNNSWVPLMLYLMTIHVFHYYYPKPLPDFTSPSGIRVAFELITGIFVYDFIFFWLHYAMHKIPLLSFCNHHVHHTQNTMCSSEVQHHSLLDGTFQVLVNIFVQRMHTPFGAKHYLSRLLHNIIITYMLTEIHGK